MPAVVCEHSEIKLVCLEARLLARNVNFPPLMVPGDLSVYVNSTLDLFVFSNTVSLG